MPVITKSLEELTDNFPQRAQFSISIPWELKPQNHLNAYYRHEIEVMAMLCRWQNPKIAFEFGTFEGFTTLVMAMNSPSDAMIYTLDLPLKEPFKTKFTLEYYNNTFVNARGKLYFRGTQYEPKICTLYADSAEFDESPLRNKVDLIFVDGNHQAEYIANDTQKAFSMCSSNGIILWHDYKTSWPDVTPFLENLSLEKKLFHIKGTNYVFFQKEGTGSTF
jgi:predicted O-methyltransferase YrrM